MLTKSNFRYEMFKLLNQEFSFEVDTSNLPCGLNGALYFVAMDADGGKVSGFLFGTWTALTSHPKLRIFLIKKTFLKAEL